MSIRREVKEKRCRLEEKSKRKDFDAGESKMMREMLDLQ